MAAFTPEQSQAYTELMWNGKYKEAQQLVLSVELKSTDPDERLAALSTVYTKEVLANGFDSEKLEQIVPALDKTRAQTGFHL